jgi:hypothetical protein
MIEHCVAGGTCPLFLSSRAVTMHSKSETAKMPLKAGDVAPQFSLPAVIGEHRIEFRLSDYRGKQCVVVTFHPLDWTPT